MLSPRILPKRLTGSEHLLGTHCQNLPSLVAGVVLTKITLEDEYLMVGRPHSVSKVALNTNLARHRSTPTSCPYLTLQAC